VVVGREKLLSLLEMKGGTYFQRRGIGPFMVSRATVEGRISKCYLPVR
jgi:hypothetical protein